MIYCLQFVRILAQDVSSDGQIKVYQKTEETRIVSVRKFLEKSLFNDTLGYFMTVMILFCIMATAFLMCLTSNICARKIMKKMTKSKLKMKTLCAHDVAPQTEREVIETAVQTQGGVYSGLRGGDRIMLLPYGQMAHNVRGCTSSPRTADSPGVKTVTLCRLCL